MSTAVATMTDRERTAWFADMEVSDALADAALTLYVAHVGHRALGPGATGSQLMDRLMPRTMHRAPIEEWPAAIVDNAPRDWVELRPLAVAERAGLFLHGYDKNAQFLAACSSVELGLYGLRHEWRPAFDKRVPGYWRVVVDGSPEAVWLTTPELAYRAESSTVAVDEAWTWEHHGRALANWYARLRDARAALMADRSDAGQLALMLLKRSYTRAIGLLNSTTWRDPATAAYRPDWRAMIVAQARANLARNIDKAGVRPVAIHTDCVYLLSPERDAVAACPPQWTLGSAPGQFKVKYAGVPIEEIAPAFESSTILRLERTLDTWTTS